jgi:4'-phosphopantetheinyl transferase EntD
MPAASAVPGRDLLASLFPPGVVTVSTREPTDPSVLDDRERRAVENVGAKRRREFAAGRLCARRALSQLAVRDFSLLNGADRAPLWPEGIVGSITHCPGYCAAAVAPDALAHSLGIDAEVSAPLAPRIVDRVCTRDERTKLRELPLIRGLDWGKLTFSAKESVYKCYFPLARTVLRFRDVELDFLPDAGCFSARLVRDDAPSAAGARRFSGRYCVDEDRVLTAVTLRAAPGRSPTDADGGRRDAATSASQPPSTRPQGGSS